ncbi:MAG: hypothetical protein J5965_10230 [Aeriscardovia sp.]|nr:hypothetical protein [Aeriscardovia sp.]
MINIPAPIMKFAGKAGNWLVKNGPTLMEVGGGLMAVGGAVMACKATLHADEVLARHAEKMDTILAAKTASDEAGDGEYTDKMMAHDKTIVYAETAVEFIKLYGPAFAVGMSGVGLMQSAFYITERRRATAVAALTSLDQMYQGLLASANEHEIDITNNPTTKVLDAPKKGEEPQETMVVDPEKDTDPFFFIFDDTNPNWCSNAFLLNERFIKTTLDAFNYRLSGYALPQVWINDILKALDLEEKDYGHFYGYNAASGDTIVYEVIPFLKEWGDEDSEQMPMLIETDMDAIRELEMNDIQEGYCFGIRLKSNSDGYDDVVDPRFIYNEVYGK